MSGRIPDIPHSHDWRNLCTSSSCKVGNIEYGLREGIAFADSELAWLEPCTHGVVNHLHIETPGEGITTYRTCASCGACITQAEFEDLREGNL